MWTLYQVSLRVLSPIHIGWKKTSNLQQTRFDVPAKTIWGALTARITRDQNSSDYEERGTEINENLRFSYFYPYDSNSNLNECEFPWENPDNFTWKYIGSYQSAALEHKNAMEGMLHETECILPKTREGNQVYLVGYIIEKKGCDIDWKKAFPKIQIGGERGYGWGRVNIDNGPAERNQFFGYGFDSSQNDPVIIVPKDKCILAHTVASNAHEKEIEGNIEPFVGRITNKDGKFGDKFSKANICWIPGSKLVTSDMEFKICKNGLWSMQNEKCQ
jgi:hypothetical protein